MGPFRISHLQICGFKLDEWILELIEKCTACLKGLRFYACKRGTITWKILNSVLQFPKIEELEMNFHQYNDPGPAVLDTFFDQLGKCPTLKTFNYWNLFDGQGNSTRLANAMKHPHCALTTVVTGISVPTSDQEIIEYFCEIHKANPKSLFRKDGLDYAEHFFWAWQNSLRSKCRLSVLYYLLKSANWLQTSMRPRKKQKMG